MSLCADGETSAEAPRDAPQPARQRPGSYGASASFSTSHSQVNSLSHMHSVPISRKRKQHLCLLNGMLSQRSLTERKIRDSPRVATIRDADMRSATIRAALFPKPRHAGVRKILELLSRHVHASVAFPLKKARL